MHRQQIETRNSGDESMIAYLKSKSSRKVQLQQESVLDQAKFNINKCSSYIDRKEQFLLANMLVNNNQKSSKKNIKKLGQRISNKFKKLIHANKASSQEESGSIRLVNFNYKETANVEMGSVKQLKRKPSLRLVNTERRRHSVLTSRTSLHSNGSTSSGSSVDQFETNSQLLSHLFSPQMGINHLASTPLTSTHHTLSQMPFLLYDTENNGECTSSCCCDHHSSSMSSQAINMALFMDQSTQVCILYILFDSLIHWKIEILIFFLFF